jgi:hypothetical protein
MTAQHRRAWVVFVLLWLVGILFPFEAVRRYSQNYRQTFDAVFNCETAHVIMHTILFGVLAGGLMRLWGGQFTKVLLAVLAAACLQESIQAVTNRGYDWHDGAFDIGVDLAGAIAVAIATWLGSRRSATGGCR